MIGTYLQPNTEGLLDSVISASKDVNYIFTSSTCIQMSEYLKLVNSAINQPCNLLNNSFDWVKLDNSSFKWTLSLQLSSSCSLLLLIKRLQQSKYVLLSIYYYWLNWHSSVALVLNWSWFEICIQLVGIMYELKINDRYTGTNRYLKMLCWIECFIVDSR